MVLLIICVSSNFITMWRARGEQRRKKIALFVLMERCTWALLEILDNFLQTIFTEFRLASWGSMSNNICTLLG